MCRIGARSSPAAFQCPTARSVSSRSARPTASSRLRQPQRGQVLAHLLGDELEEVDHELRLAVEPLAQLRVLGGHPDRAGVQVADPHHDAARHDQRRAREAELLGAEQRGDDHVPAGLELAVGLDHDPVPQPGPEQGLLGFGQAQLPGRARVLEAGQRGRTGAAVVPGDQHHVGVRLGHPGRDGADPHLGDQLDVYPGLRVGVLEVVDQLGQVFDGVDVVVRRRRDEADPRGGVPGLGDPRVHLVPGQLAALPRLGPLGHLDLQVVGVDQVLAGHPEPAAGHLLDRGAAQVPVGVRHEAFRVLAALAGVGPAAQPVHGDGQGLVRLGRDRTVGHRAGGEPAHDLGDRFHFVDGDRTTGFRPVRGRAARLRLSRQAADRVRGRSGAARPGCRLDQTGEPRGPGATLRPAHAGQWGHRRRGCAAGRAASSSRADWSSTRRVYSLKTS